MLKTCLSILLSMAIFIDIAMAVYSYRKQDRDRSFCISILSILIFIYSLGYLVELSANTADAVIIGLKVSNFAIPMIAPVVLYTTIVMFSSKLVRRWMLPAIAVFGTIMFTVVFFNEFHNLFYQHISISPGGFSDLIHGPLYILNQAVAVSCMICSYTILILRAVKGTRQARKQMLFFVIGSCIGFAANAINIMGLFPQGIDPTPFALTISLLFFSIDMFRQQLLDIRLVAFNSAVESMDDSIIVLNNELGFVYSNNKANCLFPSLSNFGGLELITSVKEWPKELMSIEEPCEVNFSLQEDEMDTLQVYRANISRVKSENSIILGWSVVIRDISEMMQMMNKLEEMAITDILTGICNRRHFLDRVKAEMSLAARTDLYKSLMLFDIDYFKIVNDTYGHMAGDCVLCEVTQIVQQQLRSHDLFARFGGEEFVVFSIDIQTPNLIAFAERLRMCLEKSEIIYAEHKIRVTASFGIVNIPPGVSFETAMHSVDLAMYEAKSQGRNCVVLGEIVDKNAKTKQ